MRLVTCVFAAVLLVGPAHADAPSYRAVIDRVDLEPATIGGYRLRVALSGVAIGGQPIDLSDHKSIQLLIDRKKVDAPYVLGTFSAADSDVALVVAIEANLAYADAIAVILDQLDQNVLSSLGEHTQVAILPYGDATGAGKLQPLKTARGRLQQVGQDGSASEPALLETLDRALLLLKRAKSERPLRKIIVVIGDGRDRAGERDRVTRLGKRADKEGVRIHTFGYAPSNVRRPLLTFGELSRQSLGTFRWVRSGGAESWAPAFQQLRDEITKQNLVTFFLPADADVAKQKVRIDLIGRVDAKSNELPIPDPSCHGEPCASGYCADKCVVPKEGNGRGVFGWIILLGGIGLTVVLGLGVIGYFLQKRQQQPPQVPMPGFPSQPPAKPHSAPPQVAMPPPTTGPYLLVMSGPYTGQRVFLTNGFTIGKAPGSSMVIDDGYTSGNHAQFGVDPGGVRLYDRNSTNGTYVNGVRVTEVALEHGMTIRIGSTELRFLAQ